MRLTDTQKEIIRGFAESGMNRTEAARRLFRGNSTVYYQLNRIKEKTGLNPWDFFDLHELLRMAGVADYVDVVRCKDCKWWKDEICTNVNGAYKNLIFNPNWYCASGERRDK